MKQNILKGVLALSSMALVIGCGSSDSTSGESTALAVQAAIDSPISVLSEELANTLSYMGNEERLAYDVYNYLYNQFGTQQFTNIATQSEYQHIASVQGLIQKYKLDDSIDFTNVDMPSLGYIYTPIEQMQAGRYDISIIQNLYDGLTAQGSNSEIDALKVGCIIEVVDVTDLNSDIAIAERENATDIVTVFNFLRDGSYNHYWSFDKGLVDRGISDGCCSLGATYCHPEYPENSNGNGRNR